VVDLSKRGGGSRGVRMGMAGNRQRSGLSQSWWKKRGALHHNVKKHDASGGVPVTFRAQGMGDRWRGNVRNGSKVTGGTGVGVIRANTR